MLKKILIILIGGFFITSGIGVSGLSNNVYQSEKIFSLFPLLDISITGEFSKENNMIPSTVDMSNDAFPEYFNWRDQDDLDWTTPVKEQLSGDCWIFTALGSLESMIKIRERCASINPDLSEQYILSCLPAAADVYGEGCNGGKPLNAFKYMMSTTEEGNNYNGAIFESCFPYQASDDVPCSDKSDNWMEYLVPISDYGRIINEDVINNSPESIEVIKNMIMQHGPTSVFLDVPIAFQIWGYTPHSPEDYYQYKEKEWNQRLNHAVVIVGWKDDSSIPNGGYWICKNSWGTKWNYGGFFNIEYGACFIGYFLDWVDYNQDDFFWSPISDCGDFYSGIYGQEIFFNGSGCIGSEFGDSISYYWDFDDGNTSSDMSPTHIYSQEGFYIANLTIVDSNNNTATDTAEVVITSDPISIDLCGGFLEATIKVRNTADFTLNNVNWKLDYIDGFPLIYDIQFAGRISIPPGEHSFLIGEPMGLGSVIFTLTIGDIIKEEKIYLIGPFLLAPW